MSVRMRLNEEESGVPTYPTIRDSSINPVQARPKPKLESVSGEWKNLAFEIENLIEKLDSAIESLEKGNVWKSLLITSRLRPTVVILRETIQSNPSIPNSLVSLVNEVSNRLDEYEDKLMSRIEEVFEKYDYIDVHNIFPEILYSLALSDYKNMIFYGRPSTGKSFTIRIIKEILNVPDERFFIVHPDRSIEDFKSLVVQPGLAKGTTEPQLSDLGYALKIASESSEDSPPVIVVFEEIDQFRELVLKQGNPFFEEVRKVNIIMYDKSLRWEVPSERLLVFGTFNATGEDLAGDPTQAFASRFIIREFGEIPDEMKIKILEEKCRIRQPLSDSSFIEVSIDEEGLGKIVRAYNDINQSVRNNTLGPLATRLTLRDLIIFTETMISNINPKTGTLDLTEPFNYIVSRVLYKYSSGENVVEEDRNLYEDTIRTILLNNLGGIDNISHHIKTTLIVDGKPVLSGTLSGIVIEHRTRVEEETYDGNFRIEEDTSVERRMNMDDYGKILRMIEDNRVWNVDVVGIKKVKVNNYVGVVGKVKSASRSRVYHYPFVLVDAFSSGKGLVFFCDCEAYWFDRTRPCKHIVRLFYEAFDSIAEELKRRGYIDDRKFDEWSSGYGMSRSGGRNGFIEQVFREIAIMDLATNIIFKRESLNSAKSMIEMMFESR